MDGRQRSLATTFHLSFLDHVHQLDVVPQSTSRDLPPRQRVVKISAATRFDTVWAMKRRSPVLPRMAVAQPIRTIAKAPDTSWHERFSIRRAEPGYISGP